MHSLSKPNVLLSIVTWNHEKTIRATIESIFNQTCPFHLVVFDNQSSDSTVEILNSYKEQSNFDIIQNFENIGFCGGHNYVIKNYSFDYIFLVNPDIILRNDYVEQTLKAFEIDPKIGAVCGLLVQSLDANPVIDSAGMQLTKSRRFVLRNHGRYLNSVKLQSDYVTGLDGALPAFKKEAVLALLINGEFFNAMFFSHKEDWDISWRLILFGWKVYFNKESVATHPRFFKPNQIKHRKKIEGSIKYHGFKNQFLLLLINEDRSNFLKDFLRIVPRILVGTVFCLFFEKKSLKAYKYIVSNKKQILALRKKVQENKKIPPAKFRQYLIAAD
jgi:GT2 family glycosyltransferase